MMKAAEVGGMAQHGGGMPEKGGGMALVPAGNAAEAASEDLSEHFRQQD